MKRNIYINLFFTLLIGILAFVINRVFSQELGQESLGLMSLMIQLVAYLNLADLGIAAASSYALYKPFEENDIKKINIILSTIHVYYKKISIIILVVGMVVAYYMPMIANTTEYGNSIYIYWMLYVINIALSYTFAKYTVLFTANQEYGLVRTIQGASRVFVLLLQLVVLIYTQSFLLFILVLSLQNFISYYFYNKHFKKEYTYILKVTERANYIKRDMKNLFWHKSATLIVFNTDFILLAQFTSLSVVAIYSTYLIVYNMLLMIVVGILTPVLTPHIGKYIAKNTKNNIYLYWNKLHLLYLIVGIVLVVTTFYTINPFIKLWMGEDYLLPIFTVALLLINLYISIIRSMTEVFKTNSGFFDDVYNPILESIINLVVSLVLVQSMGLNGVIIGTICSNVFIIYILKPLMTFKRCFNKSAIDYFYVFGKYTILTILSMYISYLSIDYFYSIIAIASWFEWFVLLIKVIIIVIPIVVMIFLLDKVFRKFVLQRIFI